MTLTQPDIKILNDMFDKKLKPLKDGLKQVGEDLKTDIKIELKPIKRKLNAIEKDLKWTMLRYDTRLTHIEFHTMHPPGRADN
jgi:uncharacterized protein YicC (UPF0701 family)